MKNLGKMGEDLATRYFEYLGFVILERNYTTRYGEIDLICERGGEVVFAEVKARSKSNRKFLANDIPESKLMRLQKTARTYIAQNDLDEYRYELFTVIVQKPFAWVKIISI